MFIWRNMPPRNLALVLGWLANKRVAKDASVRKPTPSKAAETKVTTTLRVVPGTTTPR